MAPEKISINKVALGISVGAVFSTVIMLAVLWLTTNNTMLIIWGLFLALLLFIWAAIFILIVRKKIDLFASAICRTLDDMMSDNIRPQQSSEETLFVKINHRLERLYSVLLENRNHAAEDRAKLQELISDISHQVKTPISNLKMANDLLLEQDMPDGKRLELLKATSGQLDKLDFLMQALIKTSRLEAGIIALSKTDCPIYGTLATALGSVLFSAEQRQIEVTVNCLEDLTVPHDTKWTGEALFNILDNAVKYTPQSGSIHINAERWEFYTKIDVVDNGKGIPESHQAEIFKRFYREEEVHNIDGIGVGLFLAREIITLQGGYIKVTSEANKGSTFSVFLPNEIR